MRPITRYEPELRIASLKHEHLAASLIRREIKHPMFTEGELDERDSAHVSIDSMR